MIKGATVYACVFDTLLEHIRALYTSDTLLHLNSAGIWNVGGPFSDCGLTGRKIVVEQYGADCEVGRGAFSGKDPSKADRSAASMATTCGSSGKFYKVRDILF